MRAKLTIALGTLLAMPVYAAELEINVEIPRINAAEYHRPYVAMWVEGADQKAVANLAVWYMTKDTKEGHGTKWLPDLRQWWRRSCSRLRPLAEWWDTLDCSCLNRPILLCQSCSCRRCRS